MAIFHLSVDKLGVVKKKVDILTVKRALLPVMMEFFLQYGLFLAKTATVVIAILVVMAALFFFAQKEKALEQVQVKKLNKKYASLSDTIKSHSLTKKELKRDRQKEKEAKKSKEKREKEKQRGEESSPKKRVFVIDFDGDIKASEVASLREEITAILAVAQPTDEVVARIESAGGVVHGYGLAASQLHRIRKKGIQLTATIDKVAASGGYMMACVADRILAAPFAIVGSIGVLAQLPNFNRLLKKHDIDFEQYTAGEYKRTLSLFGEITPEGRKKFLEQLEETHLLFKEFVKEHRPQVEIDEVATGEYWFGKKAIEKKLVDELITSDDYLLDLCQDADVYKLTYKAKKKLSEKLTSAVRAFIADRLWI